MSVESELFDSLENMYASDIGAGGLSNSVSEARVCWFVRQGDRSAETQCSPSVEVSFSRQPFDTFETNTEAVLVRFYVSVDYGTGIEDIDSVTGRLRTVFHRAMPTDGPGWGFSRLTCVRSGAPARDGDEMRCLMEFTTFAREL